LDCVVSVYPFHTDFLSSTNAKADLDPGGDQSDISSDSSSTDCEWVTAKQMAKHIKLLSAQLRCRHVHVPAEAFLRQILVRPAVDSDQPDTVLHAQPDVWEHDTDLEKRAGILKTRIEQLYRKEYADVLDAEPHGVNSAMPFQHVIELVDPDCKPYNQKLRRLSPLEMKLLSDYLQEMIEGGRIRPSDSPWGANVLFVPKPCGGFRCCQDYRELNKRMKHDTYPLPRIDVHMDMAQGSFWSKMDLLKGFYQLPMHPDSVRYTAFNTLLGKYEFLVMPMGLQSAPGAFMRAMNHVFEGLLWDPNLRQTSGVLVYLDDILIFSRTEEEHLQILKQVLDRLRKYKLQCRFDKCSFAVTEVEYLGFRLSHQGVRMDPRKVEVIKQWPEHPKSKSDIRAFVGLSNYLKRFCKGLSNHTAILTDWAAEKSSLPWTPAHVKAMQDIKALLSSDLLLASPKIDSSTNNYYPFTVITDASEIAVGAILLQQQGPDKADTRVIGYASSKFKQSERNYSVHEKELLGVLMAVDHWKCFLEGSKFTVYTDHQSLIWLNKLKEPSRRQARWVDQLQGHDFEVIYMKGELNPADAFTRVPWQNQVVDEGGKHVSEPLLVVKGPLMHLRALGISLKVSPSKLQDWKEATQRILLEPWKLPPLYRKIMASYDLDPKFQNVDWLQHEEIVFKDGLYFKGHKLAIPNIPELKATIMYEQHDSMLGGHLGKNKTIERVQRMFWWKGLVQDVVNHVKSCPSCQVAKYRNWRPQGHTQDLQPASKPFEVVHMDFAGPFKHKAPGAYNRVCVFVDAFTKLAVFVKCRSQLTSESLANLYIENVWKVYGRAGVIVSDNEPLLAAEAWTKVNEKLGTPLHKIAAYNAKANGSAEVIVKQLKSQLRAYEEQGVRWWKALAACERGYNDSVHSVTGFTPFYMNFGRHPYTDLNSFLEPIEQECVDSFVIATQAELAKVHGLASNRIHDHKVRETAKRNAGRKPAPIYKPGDLVYLEVSAIGKQAHSLAPMRSGPHCITHVTSHGNSVRLEGFLYPFNVELIVPAFARAPPASLEPDVHDHVIAARVEGGTEGPQGLGVCVNDITGAVVPQVDENGRELPVIVQPPNPISSTMDTTSDARGTHRERVDIIDLTEGDKTNGEPGTQDQERDNGHFDGFSSELQSDAGKVWTDKKGSGQVGYTLGVDEVWEVPSDVIMPDQLPGIVTRVLHSVGRTKNSSILTCQLSDGSQCRLPARHLRSLVGDTAYSSLMHTFTTEMVPIAE